MTQFDESKHRRDGEGKFASKGPSAEAEGVDLSAPEKPELSGMERARAWADDYVARSGPGMRDYVDAQLHELKSDEAAELWVVQREKGGYYSEMATELANGMADLGWRADEHANLYQSGPQEYGQTRKIEPRAIVNMGLTPERVEVLEKHRISGRVYHNDWTGQAARWGDIDKVDEAMSSNDPYRAMAGVKASPEIESAPRERVARLDACRAAGLNERNTDDRDLIENYGQYSPELLGGLRQTDKGLSSQEIAGIAKRGHDGASLKKWGTKASLSYDKAALDQVKSTPKEIRSLVAKGAYRKSLADVDRMAQAGMDGKRYSEVAKVSADNRTSTLLAIHRNVNDPQGWSRNVRGLIDKDTAEDIGRIRAAGVSTPEAATELTKGFESESSFTSPGVGNRVRPTQVVADLAERGVTNEQVKQMSRAGIPPAFWKDVKAGEEPDKIWEQGQSYRDAYEANTYLRRKWPWNSMTEPNPDSKEPWER